MNTPPLTRHQRNRLRTRQQLYEALFALSLEKGYDAVSIQDITDRADVARATFYLHAKDKDDLLWAAIISTIHATENELEQQYKDLSDLPPQAEYYGYRNIFEHVRRYQDSYKVILGSKGSATMRHRVYDYMVKETLKDIVSLHFYSDISAPPEIAAQIIVGSITSLAIWWLETPNEYSPTQMAQMVYEVLHHRKPPE
ncbi:MAG: TetR/AcrR family transcriptional regulator [Anaerolineales bacterium]|nr:TetR/AcrR family transcriptional regulator [Anaerolineales bacterium]